jgi:serine phosphatase RsbU (regulator of sigma subunit)/ActR/RegA family two-component response regulator
MKLLKKFLPLIFCALYYNMVIAQENDFSIGQAINEMEFQASKYEKEKNMLELARCQTRLGFLYKEKNNNHKAIENFLKAIKSNEDLGNTNAVKSICANIGLIYSDIGDYEQALLFLRKSLRINEKQGKKTEVLSDLVNIAQILQIQRNYTESNENLLKVVTLAQEFSDYNSLKNAYASLSENYDKMNNLDKSKEYFDLASALKTLIQKEEIKKIETKVKVVEAESNAKDLELKSKDQKIQKITKEQQLTLDLLNKEKELNDLRKKEHEAKERINRLIIISLVSFLLVVLISLFFIFKQFRAKKKAFRMLEESNKQITEQKKEIELQRDIATNQKKKITDSIYYAKRIQNAVLPPVTAFEKVLPEHFLLYRPRDIVSGDFYWMTEKEGIVIIAAADCTGHGVPGAFMSMLGIAYLNDIVNKIAFNKHIRSLQANEILNQLREHVITSLHQTGKSTETKDGMDIALCIIDFEHKLLQYAGAHNPVYIIRKGELTHIEADKMPIGIYRTANVPFSNHEIKLEKDDLIYIFSDGYYDQFGGQTNTKMFSQRFRKYLLEIHDKPLKEQKQLLEDYYETWKGSNEQVDDVMVLGFRFAPHVISASTHEDYQWQNKKILIAEDVDLNFILLAEALKPTGAQISRVLNGKDAVEFCKSNSLDLVLMDIRMPEMDGIEATKHIRAFNQEVPIIAQTALSEDGDLGLIQEAGCNDYISKPINLKLFLNIIKKHLVKEMV